MTQIPKTMIYKQFAKDIQGSSFDSASSLKLRDLSPKEQPKTSFSDYLKDEVKELNQSQKVAEDAAADLASGKAESIHETMLKSTQAELNFNLFVQLRNKALDAYHEVMRMQV